MKLIIDIPETVIEPLEKEPPKEREIKFGSLYEKMVYLENLKRGLKNDT